MNKEIEALKRIETTFSMNKQGKESVYREYTNSVYPYYEDFDLVLKALQRLEQIDNAEPSEALECLEKLLNGYSKGMAGRSYYDTIKQALLKQQEPKKYLKWEDLEFEENKEIDVLMNGNKYVLELRPKNTRREYLDEVIIYNIEKQGVIALNEIEAETFNDLRLERVEE